MPLDRTLYDTHAERIKALPLRSLYEKDDLLTGEFRLETSGSMAIYYSPLDYLNAKARVVLVGITPGWTQMELGYRTARAAQHAGCTMDDVCSRAKGAAAFAGPMRANLISMLDGIGLGQALRLGSTSELFGPAAALVHTTSAIRYPVFIAGENYTGHMPRLLGTPQFVTMIEKCLAEELSQTPDALIVPLGRASEDAITYLADRGTIDPGRALFGFPHPSGGNGHRIRHFAERRSDLSRRVDEWFKAV
jgi:hypothetical protein